MAGPSYTFKIFPLRTRLHFKVHIFNTLNDLRSYTHGLTGGPKRFHKDCVAMVISQLGVRDGRTTPLLGEILFCEKHLTNDIITHELAHAMFILCERKGWKDRLWTYTKDNAAADEQESACYGIGWMREQIDRKLDRIYGSELALAA